MLFPYLPQRTCIHCNTSDVMSFLTDPPFFCVCLCYSFGSGRSLYVRTFSTKYWDISPQAATLLLNQKLLSDWLSVWKCCKEQAVAGKQAELNSRLVPFRDCWKGELNPFSGLSDVCQRKSLLLKLIPYAVSEAYMDQLMWKCAVKHCHNIGRIVTWKCSGGFSCFRMDGAHKHDWSA